MKEKKEVYKVKPSTEGKKNIIATLIEEYNIKTGRYPRSSKGSSWWNY